MSSSSIKGTSEKAVLLRGLAIAFATLWGTVFSQPSQASVEACLRVFDSSSRVSKLEPKPESKSAQAILGRPLSAPENRYLDTMATLVRAGNGVVKDEMFVSKPGLLLLSHSGFEEGSSFARRKMQMSDFQELTGGFSASFLIAGIPVETSMELIAHNAEVARLTSSKTKVMSTPMYRLLSEQDAQGQQELIERFAAARERFRSMPGRSDNWSNAVEDLNVMNMGNKATALSYTMRGRTFEKMFMGRLAEEGNETELRHIVRRMSVDLNEKWPVIFQTPERYIESGVGGRYRSEEKSPMLLPLRQSIGDGGGRVSKEGWVIEPGVELVARTELTSEARALFQSLNIDMSQSPSDQLIEFQSRITYLSFPKKPGSAREFNLKMIRELQHLSVASAFSATFSIAGISQQAAGRLSQLAAFHVPDRKAGESALLVKNGDLASVPAETLSHLMKAAPQLLEPYRATHAFLTLNLRDFHSLFVNGLPKFNAGSEESVVLLRIAKALHQRYPLVIREPEFYLGQK